MTPSNFPDRVLETIEQEHVTPHPAWLLRLRRLGVWISLAGLAIVGALFSALSVLALLELDTDVLQALHAPRAALFLAQSVPLLWVAFIALAAVFGIALLRKETRAYRWRAPVLAILLVTGMLLAGGILHRARIVAELEQRFERGIPSAMKPFVIRHHFAPGPEAGVLIGKIVESHAGALKLHTPQDMFWVVRYEPGILIATSTVEPNRVVIVRGEIAAPGFFEAEWIKPYRRDQFFIQRKSLDANIPGGRP